MKTPDRVAVANDLDAMRWRCVGPPRGGRVVAVAGEPVNPMVFYFGACAGGIWKTTDGGRYWKCVSDGYLGSAAIGAIQVAASDPTVVYAGTGETTIRLDVSYGDGLYKSRDAGRSWTHIGLRDSKFIGEIRIHPSNPDLVYVAVLGDIFGRNEERGVYRSSNGGESWEKVLDAGDQVGAVDLAMDMTNPNILFASTWRASRSFWNLSSGGEGCGLHRSADGGDTWDEISTNSGFATGMLGKIGVAVSPVKPGRVWALVEAGADQTGLYRSEDYGDDWTLVCSNRDLMHRPWYYTHVFADTAHADTVYVTNLQMWKSTDGGVGFSEIVTPHGDNHDLWIDPNDPLRMIEGNDGGANVSFDGGDSWSSIYNQNTAQFYRMDIDNQHPYRLYATQQDNTSISVPSATEWGVVTMGDCHLPGTGESGFIAVDPKDPNVVFVGAVGSSPGGSGAIQRYDHATRQMQLVNVWPEESTGIAPRDLKYRFAWTFPIVFSPNDPNTIYVGGNHVFRSRNDGMSWDVISPDLSRNEQDKLDYSGGPLTGDSAGAEVYASCASVVENPGRRGEIWASSDDGLVHVTRDDGGSWENVTPPDMPEYAYVGCVEISVLEPNTVYIAATRYKLADYAPYLFKSKDSGRSWVSINGDLPGHEITRVVRADPTVSGLLFIGSETGVFFSVDNGAHWRRMAGGFPVVPVYDLKFKDADLCAATHGRSFWILDDVTPLREVAAGVAVDGLALFTPRETTRGKLVWSVGLFAGEGKTYGPAFGVNGASEYHKGTDGRQIRIPLDVGENPPNGAIIYYKLPKDSSGPVTITIKDEFGATVFSVRGDDEETAVDKRPTALVGLNRFVWDLKHEGPTRIDPSLVALRNKPFTKSRGGPAGPAAMPGAYSVELAVHGTTRAASFTIVKDPRLATTDADFRAQHELWRLLADALGNLNDSVNRIRRMKKLLLPLSERLAINNTSLSARASGIAEKLSDIEAVMVDTKRESPRDVLRHPAGLDDTLGDLIGVTSIADAAPPSQAREVADEIVGLVTKLIAEFDTLVEGEIAGLNADLRGAGIDFIGSTEG
jgi:photosystem II stability/assembly factor-like uncharacterized protein